MELLTWLYGSFPSLYVLGSEKCRNRLSHGLGRQSRYILSGAIGPTFSNLPHDFTACGGRFPNLAVRGIAGSCFSPTAPCRRPIALHTHIPYTLRSVATMPEQASKKPPSEHGRESALDPAPPASKRRRIGLACNACRVRKSRYAMPMSANND